MESMLAPDMQEGQGLSSQATAGVPRVSQAIRSTLSTVKPQFAGSTQDCDSVGLAIKPGSARPISLQ
jgi:hypothetical protein